MLKSNSLSAILYCNRVWDIDSLSYRVPLLLEWPTARIAVLFPVELMHKKGWIKQIRKVLEKLETYEEITSLDILPVIRAEFSFSPEPLRGLPKDLLMNLWRIDKGDRP